MEKRPYVAINLPETLKEMSIRIGRCPCCRGILFGFEPECAVPPMPDCQKYFFVWHRNDYLKVERDELLWIEANGSYSKIHLRDGNSMLLSFNLSVIERDLPQDDFVRVHRSYIVNLKNVVSLMGNSVKIADRYIPIGREYRNSFFRNFIFLGTRSYKYKK